jgi:hypothetical protein
MVKQIMAMVKAAMKRNPEDFTTGVTAELSHEIALMIHAECSPYNRMAKQLESGTVDSVVKEVWHQLAVTI